MTAIVVTFRTGPRLRECLYALAVNADIAEIIIVDNGNPDHMTRWLAAFSTRYETVTYLQTGENLGFGTAVNRGVARATTDEVLIINPDCVIRPDAIAPMQLAAIDQLFPWVVGGRIYNIEGVNQRGPQRHDLTLGRALSKMVGGTGINMPLDPQPDAPVPVDVTSGAFFLMERAGFAHVGGFDEDYFLHVEDIDLCKRVRDAGGAVIYQPQAGALHFGATSDVTSAFVAKHKAASFARYFRKFAKGPLHRLLAELCIPFIYWGLRLRG